MKIAAVIPTAGDAAVAVTPDSVWFNVNTGVLQRRDPVTNEIIATITIPGGPYSAHGISASPEGIFLANNYDGTVWRVDQETNTLAKLTDIGTSAGTIVEVGGWLWIDSASLVFEVNPTTGVTRRTIPLDVHDLISDEVSDAGSLWGATNGRDVVRIDPGTGSATTVSLPPGIEFALALAADPSTGAVWAASPPRAGDPGPPRLVRVTP
jgi:streptogramin lyase